MPKPVYHACGYVKKACALVNAAAGRLPEWKRDAIVRAADEMIAGRLDDHYPLFVWQTGSGTQSNMNVNEVISNRAIQLFGGTLGSQRPIGPNDDVNMGQSSNDTFPTAMHIASVEALDAVLLPQVTRLAETIERKADGWMDVVKIGRTHLEDAVPLTFGQEWHGWAGQIRAAISDVEASRKGLYELAVAATRIVTGADFDCGALTHLLVGQLSAQPGFAVHYNHEALGLAREDGGRWRVTVEDTEDGTRKSVSARFVFIGAAGASLDLLQASGIPEGRGYGGFPVSGIWLRRDANAVSARHHAKVYGKAASGSPPMSVPHLDTRIIGGKRSLLFGPCAGFSSRFLKHGSLTDLFRSITLDNVVPMLDVAKDNVKLTEYLIGQVLQSSRHQFGALRRFFPNAKRHDWQEAVAGQRVQIIKPDSERGGVLEFGTELVTAGDKSLVALVGASPGASTAAFIALEVLQTCFAGELTPDGWLPVLRRMIPTFGIDLRSDADACRHVRADTARALELGNV